MQAGLPITRLKKSKFIQGYIGKPKGAQQIVCKQGLINTDGLLPDGRMAKFQGTVSKDALTGEKNNQYIQVDVFNSIGPV